MKTMLHKYVNNMNLIYHCALIYTVLLNSLFDYIDKKIFQKICVYLNKLKIISFIGGLDNASIAIIR